MRILDLLNTDDLSLDRSSESTAPLSRSPVRPLEKPCALTYRVDKLFRSKVHSKLLKNTKLVDIALRKKSSSRKGSSLDVSGLKLHMKLLGAGLRVRLVLCPSIYDIYHRLTPNTSRNDRLYKVSFDPKLRSLVSSDVSLQAGQAELLRGEAIGKRVRIIDNNLVDLAGVSSKVLKALSNDRSPDMSEDDGSFVTTFNELDTAIMSLFKVPQYTLVRVTRSASSNSEGSVLGKLETAKPGDPGLIDDREFVDDMVASLGRSLQAPNNLFIKKIVARPRYKVDMKLYIVPADTDVLVWVDQRIFERDLVNGVLDFDDDPGRDVYTIFQPDAILDKVRDLLARSANMLDSESEVVPNHMTKGLHGYFNTLLQDDKLDSVMLLGLLESLLVP